MKNEELKKRILETSYKKGLSHIGSCLTAVDIIDEIFQQKRPDDKFVLSSGHAGLALYVILEKYKGLDAETIFDHHGVHPDRCSQCGIDCSSGSLGHGLGIAVGMALADRKKHVYCLISDGECAEGSIAEALRIKSFYELTNLQVYLNDNGIGAYRSTGADIKVTNLYTINSRSTDMEGWPSWLQGQQAHYVVMDEKMYKEALEVVK